MFDFNQFIENVTHQFMKHDGSQRYGQFLMNYMAKNHPEIEIPEECDCFYDNNKAPMLLGHLDSLSRSN